MKNTASKIKTKTSAANKIELLSRREVRSKPISLILDTDIGNDIDDALALVLIHALESLNECRLLGIAINKDNDYAPVFTDIINTFYGRGDIPIGMVRDGKTPSDGFFLRPIVEAEGKHGYLYPRTSKDRQQQCAVKLYRELLSQQPDHSVSIVSIGFFTNLAKLLKSGLDEFSPLDGKELVAQKVRLMSAMAGNFSEQALKTLTAEYAEHNVVHDIESAQYVCDHWPTSMIFSGIELGEQITFPAEIIEQGFSWAPQHPVIHAYKIFKKMPYDRPLWDLTSVLFAVRSKHEYFRISPRGDIKITDNGCVTFREDILGHHQYLTVDLSQCSKIQAELVKLCSFMPTHFERTMDSEFD